MDTICIALLCGHRKTTVNGIEIELQPLKRDTAKNREREAQKRAKEILTLLN
ncbi:MAG: hypothetical protein KDD03_13150 [Gelidibacter sp.]|nr:hypothetical protein [Gelidibacter sp.]